MMALAKAQVRFGEYDDAVANAERARRLHPMAPEYYAYVHGQALYAAHRRDEASAVIEECLIRAPRDANRLLIQAALQSGGGELRQPSRRWQSWSRRIRHSRWKQSALTAGSVTGR